MSNDLKAKLGQLKELHELGLLTDAELAEQKRAALGAFMGSNPASSAASLAGPTTVDSGSAAPPSAVHPLAGATTVDPAAGLPSRLGNYRVLGIIGAGGMGTVVRARHDSEGWARRQGGDVALKLIHPHIATDDAFRERFFAEAALGKRVHHPGLAEVYDVVTEGAWLGVILEYIEGRELTEWVRPGGLPAEEVVELLAPLAEAVDHLHAEGIVHRDLKPANVRVRPDGRPVLLDLGIAKDLSGMSSTHTKTMTAMGTSAWMAPEQADAGSVTAAADVYAFGLIAYALLSGRLPWKEGDSDMRVMTNKMMGKLAPLASVAPSVAGPVAQAVMGALEVVPEARPGSCGALVAALTGGPVTGADTSAVSRSELAAILVSVVAEKTGYPAEMLSLELDMEGDLGIDAIKRVEIFTALQERVPALAGVDASGFEELRSLGEVVDACAELQRRGGTADARPESSAIVAARTGDTGRGGSRIQWATGGGVRTGPDLPALLLAQVSEQTGYPAEMLTPEMDLQSDLGLDLPARARLLQAVQAQVPELAGIQMRANAELRTARELGERLTWLLGARRWARAREAAARESSPVSTDAPPSQTNSTQPREPGPQPHTHSFVGPLLEVNTVLRSREVVESEGFLGFGRSVRQEDYTVREERVVGTKPLERSAERVELAGQSFVLVRVPAGTYRVGSEAQSNERPPHKVRLSRPFGMGVHPVTQGLWQAVMGQNPAKFKKLIQSTDRPVERVSWRDTVSFCNRLSEQCGLSPAYRIRGNTVLCDFQSPGFRLPTEHEWEVAARAKTDLPFAGGHVGEEVAWTSETAAGQPHPVGQKVPNSWGLYDMSGNVWEWCWDRYGAYSDKKVSDPTGSVAGGERVRRGGSWSNSARTARVSYRDKEPPNFTHHNLGFRLARTLKG